MTSRLGVALASSLFASLAHGGCLAIAAHPEGASLALLNAPTFAVGYVHSVTRTPVEERYALRGDAIVQSSMRFVEHGPGLPTESDAGYAFERTPQGFAVTMDRTFERIVMRVAGAQSPRLTAGDLEVDLARWGDRAIVLTPASCASH
jgi:hypothetical protein